LTNLKTPNRSRADAVEVVVPEHFFTRGAQRILDGHVREHHAGELRIGEISVFENRPGEGEPAKSCVR